MRKRQGLVILIVVVCSLWIMSKNGHSEPVQLFLDPVSEPVLYIPLEIEILVLDKNGRIDVGVNGKKELQIEVEEKGGLKDKSFSIRSKEISFKKGKGSFFIEDNEEESLNLYVKIPDLDISGDIKLFFQDKDVSPPEVTGITSNEPGLIRLDFNETLEEESAQETKNYKAVTNQQEVYPESIEYHQDNVVLEFEEYFANDEEGYIEMEGIKDLNGNQIPSGLKSPDFKGKCPCSKRL